MAVILARRLPVAVLVTLLGSAVPLSGQPRPGDLFPLEVGNRWEYRLGSTRKLVIQATRQVVLDKRKGIELKASSDGAAETEVLVVQKDGIYRHVAEGKEIKPPLCILRLPAKPDTTWKVESVHEELTIKGTFKLSNAEISVPAGRYKTIMVHSDDLEMGTRQMKLTTWFAPGVGPVKQRLQVADVELVLELEKFISAP